MISVRAFAVQFKQALAFAESYGTFSSAMDQLFETQVIPYLTPDRPNLVVLNEVMGLLTCFIGTRGTQARSCGHEPGDIRRAFALLGAAYAPQIAWYLERFQNISPQRALLLATSDTMNRAFLSTFGALAARHAVYLVAGTAMAEAVPDATPEEAQLLGDPERPDGAPAYIARSPEVYNAAYVWGPDGRLLGRSRKVNLTAEEGPEGLDLSAATLGPLDVPVFDTPAGRLGIAISLDAFVPSYVNYLDDLGVELFLQPEANSGLWAAYADRTEDPPGWQPQTWMASCWLAVQRSRGFQYGINPFMVGNFFDLPFDGQSAIIARCRHGELEGHYAGNATPVPGERFSGPRQGFLRLAPWVLPSSEPRERLEERARQLAPGSGVPEENDYLETCLWADLSWERS